MKKNFLPAIFACLFVALSFYACKDDGNDDVDKPTNGNDSEYYTESGTVSTLKEDAIQYIDETVTEGSTLLFGSHTPKDVLPKIGTTILVPMSEKTPYGFLGKVTSVEEEGGQIKVNTEMVALDEAFPNLSVDTTFNFLDIIDGVYDEDGNPVDYEIVTKDEAQTRAGGTLEIEKGENGGPALLKIPIKSEKLGDFTVGGSLDIGFGDVKLDIDNKDGLKYLNFSISPYVTTQVKLETKVKETSFKPIRSKRYRITGRLMPVPALIIPVTFYGNFICGVKGEISASLTLQYANRTNCYVRYNNEQWASDCVPVSQSENDPWNVEEFDFKGELYGGVELGVLVGLYTATSGIGVNAIPKISLSAEAKLESLDPFHVNPKVSFSGQLESSIYCIAELFGKKLGKWELVLPEVTFFTKSMYLLPEFTGDFLATGSGSSSGEVSYQIDSYYFLKALGVKTGTTVFESNKTTELQTLYPAQSSVDKNGIRYYNAEVNGLNAGKTYYAAPVISWLNFKWTGEKHEFLTEGSYTFAMRCINQSYDVNSFNFSLNNVTGNNLDVTIEASDYGDGGLMRMRIVGQYNPDSGILSGQIGYFFYSDPSQQRIDAFSVSLANNDSGYVTMGKVIDNGGCTAAVRIYQTQNLRSAHKLYNKAIVEEDCNVGYYKKY
ncbi:MAG: hypothetical protein LBB84_04820 [Tannerellaceae bacterium]|nr:hypothetical protein [Tannerellaceae bacterium]